jgi:hypothetical protein
MNVTKLAGYTETLPGLLQSQEGFCRLSCIADRLCGLVVRVLGY